MDLTYEALQLPEDEVIGAFKRLFGLDEQAGLSGVADAQLEHTLLRIHQRLQNIWMVSDEVLLRQHLGVVLTELHIAHEKARKAMMGVS